MIKKNRCPYYTWFKEIGVHFNILFQEKQASNPVNDAGHVSDDRMLQPVAKMLRHSHQKTTFLVSNRSWSQVCEIWYWPPSSLPFKVVPPSFEHGLVLLATLIRGGGGSQAQDHGQAIYAKIRYSISSTFATGCSTEITATDGSEKSGTGFNGCSSTIESLYFILNSSPVT